MCSKVSYEGPSIFFLGAIVVIFFAFLVENPPVHCQSSKASKHRYSPKLPAVPFSTLGRGLGIGAGQCWGDVVFY